MASPFPQRLGSRASNPNGMSEHYVRNPPKQLIQALGTSRDPKPSTKETASHIEQLTKDRRTVKGALIRQASRGWSSSSLLPGALRPQALKQALKGERPPRHSTCIRESFTNSARKQALCMKKQQARDTLRSTGSTGGALTEANQQES